jgi:hypothetical protein
VSVEGAAPIAEVPPSRPQSARSKPGWTSTDFLVVLLAVLVLALSIAGLVLLLRG